MILGVGTRLRTRLCFIRDFLSFRERFKGQVFAFVTYNNKGRLIAILNMYCYRSGWVGIIHRRTPGTDFLREIVEHLSV